LFETIPSAVEARGQLQQRDLAAVLDESSRSVSGIDEQRTARQPLT
jgi:hypothetical protein